MPIVLVSVGPERTQTIERAWRPMRHRPAVAGATGRADEPAPADPRSSIVGGGGREHALAWKLAAEPGVNEVVVAPGIGGDRRRAAGPRACRRRPARSRGGRRGRPRRVASSSSSSGPEAPLAAGVADALRRGRHRGVRADARPRRGSRRSKAFCHEVAEAAGVPMARGRAFADGTRRRRSPTRRRSPRTARRRRQGGRPRGGQGRDRLRPIDEAPSRAVDRRGHRPASRRSSSRSGSTGREASVIAICDGARRRRAAGRPRPQAAARRRPARTPAAWAPTRRCRTCPTTRRRARSSRRVPPAGPRRARPARHAVPRRPLRRPDAHRRRAAAPRVQRPLRRSRRRR